VNGGGFRGRSGTLRADAGIGNDIDRASTDGILSCVERIAFDHFRSDR
jgi:hypothetical protein